MQQTNKERCKETKKCEKGNERVRDRRNGEVAPCTVISMREDAYAMNETLTGIVYSYRIVRRH